MTIAPDTLRRWLADLQHAVREESWVHVEWTLVQMGRVYETALRDQAHEREGNSDR
jgi:hypothetical protein